MTAWIVIILCGAGSYLLRIVPVELLGRIQTPRWLERVAVLTAPVAFSALAATTLADAAGGRLGAFVPRVVSVVVAAAVAHRTHSTGATIGTGMLTLWLASGASAALTSS